MSVDIDLFTDAVYDAIDFKEIDSYLRQAFSYVSPFKLPEIIGMGVSYIVGASKDNSFKLDLFYTTDPFVYPLLNRDGVRLAAKEEIAAMKINVVQNREEKRTFGTYMHCWMTIRLSR